VVAVLLGVVALWPVGVVVLVRRGDPGWLLAAVPVTLALWAFGHFAPMGYALGGDGVQVHRRAGVLVIPYRAIRGCDAERRSLSGLTMFGSRGIFGHVGHFWSPRLGHYRLYLANTRDVVWVATETGWVALSPERPAEFLERLRGRLSRAS
jgi:hypothetical protein